MKKFFIVIIIIAAGLSFNYEILADENAPDNATALSNKKPRVVQVYTMPDSSLCKKACQFFLNNKINFVEYDITASAEIRRRFDELESRGVPLIFIGSNRILGYNEDTLKKAIINWD